jgi:hypothetical protein
MNNNFGSNENNNTVPKEMPTIPPVEGPTGMTEPIKFEQPVSMPSVYPVEEPIGIPQPVQKEQSASMPSLYPTEQPAVTSEPVQMDQPVSMPSVYPVEEPIGIPEPVQMDQSVSTSTIYPVEPPAVTSESAQFEQPVSMPSVYPVEEPTVTPAPVQMEHPVSNNEMVQAEPPMKKKKGIKALLLILILLTLCLIGGGAYFAYSKNEKVIINNSVKQLENFKEYFLTPLSLNDSDEYSEKGTFNIQMSKTNNANTNQIIDILNSMKFDYNFSKTAEKTLLELNVSDTKEEIAGVKLLTTSDTGYVFLNKIFDKYIEVAELKDALSSTNYNDIEDYNYLYNFVQKSFINNVNEKDFVKDTAEITIDGEKKQVNSLKLEYNDKQILELLDLIITDIKADERANEIVTNIYEDFASYNMTSSIEAIDEEHMSTYTYTVYTSRLTNIVQGIDFDYKYYNKEYSYDNCYDNTSEDGLEDTSDSALENMKSTTENYKVTSVDDDTTTSDNQVDDYTIYDYEGNDSTTYDYTTDDYTTDDYTTTEYQDCSEVTYNEKTVSIQYRKDTNPRIYISEDNDLKGFAELVKEDQILTINIYKSEDEKLGYIKINSTKTLYEVTADFKDEQSEYKLTFSTNIEEVSAGEEYNLDSIITYEEYTAAEKTNSISVNINGTVKTSASIEETTTGSVKYDELTEEQQQEIYNNVMSILSEKMG